MIETIELYANRPGQIYRINAVQNESQSRTFEFVVYDTQDMQMDLYNAEHIYFHVEKNDGNKVQVPCTIDNNTILATPNVQAYTRIGENRCTLQIIEANSDIRFGNIFLMVRPSGIDDVESSSDYALLKKLIDTVKYITDNTEAEITAWLSDLKIRSEAEYNTLIGYFKSLMDLAAQDYSGFKNFLDLLKGQSTNDYAALQQWFTGFQTDANDSFYNWFNNLQSTLTGNAETNLLNLINALTGRVETLENMVFTGFTANPYLIRLNTLNGLIIEGTWDAALHCVEC